MFKSIMVATDLSEASDLVVGGLSAFRTLGTEHVILLHCLGIKHLQEMKHWLASMVETKLQEQKATLEKQGYRIGMEIAPGLPQFEIDRVAKEKRCALIVVGTHGKTMSSEIRLGSVASEVTHNAQFPVLLVRLKITAARDRDRCETVYGNTMEHILYPTDFSDNAERAFTYVKDLAQSGARHFTLLHVQDKERIGKHLEDRLEEFNRIDLERLERLKSSLTSTVKSEVETAIVHGMPVPEILKKAQENGITLIVMGSHGRGLVSELFLGSISHNIARHSTVSVLLVPAPRKLP